MSSSITVQDTSSTSTTGQSGQSLVTGTPTIGSTALFGPFTAYSNTGPGFAIMVSGTWTGTLTFEASIDNGVTFVPYDVLVVGTGTILNSVTANCIVKGNLIDITHLRLRATAPITGTANVAITMMNDADLRHTAINTAGGTTDTNLIQVGGAAIALGQTIMSGSIPVVLPSNQGANPLDPTATTGTITVVDSGTSSVTNSVGQVIYTGTPTANSFVSATFNGETSFTVLLSGTVHATFAFERSMDGGTTWIMNALEEISLGSTVSSLAITDNNPYILRGNSGASTRFRVRCTAYTSGTANVRIQPSYGVANVPVGQFGGPWTSTQSPQQAITSTLQNQATSSGNGSVATVTGYDGALCLEIDNGAGTCTVTLQGSFDNFATAQSAQVVGLIQVSTNAAGTATGTTSRGLTTSVSVAANTSYSLQVNDIYPNYRAVISSASGLGAGTYFTGCTAKLYLNPV